MKKIFNVLFTVMCIVVIFLIYVYKYDIIRFIYHKYYSYTIYTETNNYTKGKDYILFKRTDNFVPNNKYEIYDILYTILDNGMSDFAFYCGYDCKEDINEISDGEILNVINGYVHPYNSYHKFNISIDNYDVVTISVIKNYSKESINLINSKIIEISKEIYNKNSSKYEQIKAIHDYIINNTYYDEEEANMVNVDSDLYTSRAYNVLVNGMGICEGYTDAMAIYLNFMGIDNIKVATDDHVWNAINLDGKWYHTDLTWDDPITSNHTNYLRHDYFMLTNDELRSKDDDKHDYNLDEYKELN